MSKYVENNLSRNETIVKKADLNALAVIIAWVVVAIFLVAIIVVNVVINGLGNPTMEDMMNWTSEADYARAKLFHEISKFIWITFFILIFPVIGACLYLRLWKTKKENANQTNTGVAV